MSLFLVVFCLYCVRSPLLVGRDRRLLHLLEEGLKRLGVSSPNIASATGRDLGISIWSLPLSLRKGEPRRSELLRSKLCILMFARFFTLLRNDDFEATEDRIFTSDIKFVLEP